MALQRDLDGDLAALYRERGLAEISTRFAYPLIRLAHQGPMTIRALAGSVGRTHSALSQTVAAMRAAELVQTRAGADARTKVVHLTDKATALLPFLEAEWRATERAIHELDAELEAHLRDYVQQMRQRVAVRSFKDRVASHLQVELAGLDASAAEPVLEPGHDPAP